MYKAQESLVNHINNSGLFKTVNNYAGELKDAVKLRGQLPAALAMHKLGSYDRHNKNTNIDILVITESRSFAKADNLSNNTQLASQLIDYLIENLMWEYDSAKWVIEEGRVNSETILQDNRFTVVALSAQVNRHTV